MRSPLPVAMLPILRWRVILLFASVVPVMPLPSPSEAAVEKGPYLQDLRAKSILVCWETAAPQDGRVEFGLTPAYGNVAAQSAPSSRHEIMVSPLSPDTLYHYRVISGRDTTADASFRTMTSPGRPFRFLAYGDNRTIHEAHQQVIDRMVLVDPPPAFLVSVGDLTASGTLEEYQAFFRIERPLLASAPLFPVPGSHDLEEPANWHSFFSLPGNELYYSFRYGSCSFHCLNGYDEHAPGSEQYEWFLNELEADSADATVRHIIVTIHQPPYSTCQAHGSDLDIREHLAPLFERFGVQLTFQGHNHCYEHSVKHGVHYVTTGGGGAPLYDEWGSAEPWTVHRETTLQFTQVDVRGDSLDVQAIRPGGEQIESFRIVRR